MLALLGAGSLMPIQATPPQPVRLTSFQAAPPPPLRLRDLCLHYPGYSPERLLRTAEQIAVELERLEMNHPTAVPGLFLERWSDFNDKEKNKGYTPIRQRCPGCRNSGPLVADLHHDVYAHVKHVARTAVVFGEEIDEKVASYNAKLLHAAPENRQYWVDHVRGFTPTGEMFSRGVYYVGTSGLVRNMAWDFDKDAAKALNTTPHEMALRVIRKLHEFRLLHGVYFNVSQGQSGMGRHVHLATENIPQWFAYALSRAVITAAGMEHGTQPSKGHVECNPKQHSQSKNYGNLLGSPVSLSLMPHNHRTALIDPENWNTPIKAPSHALHVLKSVRRVKLQELLPLASAVGLDPNVMPESLRPRPAAPRPEEIRTNRGTFRFHRTMKEGTERLKADICARITPAQFLALVGVRPSTDSGHYYCPIHGEKENARSFHLFTHATTGVQLWKCLGDCDKAGDVTSLAYRVWRTSWKQAVDRLAKHVGLDPNAPEYQAKLELEPDFVDPFDCDDEFYCENPDDDGIDIFAEPEQELPKQLPQRAIRRTLTFSAWCERWVPTIERKCKLVRALARVLLVAKFEVGTIVDMLAHRPILEAYSQSGGVAALAADVSEVQDMLARGRHPPGKGWLVENVGVRALADFSIALRHEKGESYVGAMRKVAGFGTLPVGHRDWLNQVRNKYGSESSQALDALLQDDEGKVDRKRVIRVLNQLKRPVGCGRFMNKREGISTTGETDLGASNIRCESKLCLSCASIKAVQSEEFLKEQWKDKPGTVYGIVEVVGLERLEDVDDCKTFLGKNAHAPRITLVSFDEDGKPKITWIVGGPDGKFNMTNLRGKVRWWVGHAKAHGGRKALASAQVIMHQAETAAEAIDLAVGAQLDFAIHARRLIDERREDELVRFLAWADGKQLSRRGKNALPWPTREERKKDDEKDAPEPMPGTDVTYVLLLKKWNRTTRKDDPVEIARRLNRPWTIDHAIAMAEGQNRMGDVIDLPVENPFQVAA